MISLPFFKSGSKWFAIISKVDQAKTIYFSTLWDPKSPRGLSSTSQREIWAPITPIRPQTPPTQINNKTPLETMTEKFLESLPNE